MRFGDILSQEGFVFEHDSFVRKVNDSTNIRIDLKGFVTFRQYNVERDTYNFLYIQNPIINVLQLYALFVVIGIVDSSDVVKFKIVSDESRKQN